MTPKQALGEKLKARREFLKLTQQEVADAMSIGRVGYALYESGKNSIAATDLPKLAKILKVKPEYFFGWNDEDAHHSHFVREAGPDYDPNRDEPTDDEEGEILRYYRGVPPTLRPAALAMLKGLMDAEPDYEEGRVFGRKAE
jgi:transcriptional regulator with XRE-family HTH domain